MSTGQNDPFENWAATLNGESTDRQLETLRQVASHDEVQGLTCPAIRLAGSSHDEVRMWAAEALESSIQPKREEVLQLIQLLEQAADGEICYWAATMLGRLGQESAVATAALANCLQHSMYLPARERAAWALGQIGAEAASAITTLDDARQTAPPRLSQLAAEAIAAIRDSASQADSGNSAGEAAA